MVRLRRFLVSGLSLNPAARLPAKTSKKEVKMHFRPKELASNFYLFTYLSIYSIQLFDYEQGEQ